MSNTKLVAIVRALEQAGVKVHAWEESTMLTDACIDVGRGLTIQVTPGGDLFLVTTFPDGKMSFDAMQPTKSVGALIVKVKGALADLGHAYKMRCIMEASKRGMAFHVFGTVDGLLTHHSSWQSLGTAQACSALQVDGKTFNSDGFEVVKV